MLWNLVFDFYIQYIFGGFINGSDYYDGLMGTLFDIDGNYYDVFTSSFGTLSLTGYDDNFGGLISAYMPIGNYLSFIATIITMVIIVICCAKLVLYIFNTMRRIIS